MDDTQPDVDEPPSLRYQDVFAVAPAVSHQQLHGDKILLPQSALEALLGAASLAQRSDGLPQPLTFRLVHTANKRAVCAGIREFSAPDGQIGLSPYLRAALGIDADDDHPGKHHIAVAFHGLPKGTFVHLRPLAAGYNPDDWRALLERQLREGYTTLTKGAELTVRGSVPGESFRFRIDGFQPPGDAVCVVDTDLEVDIEALDEEQARETVRQIQANQASQSQTTQTKGGSPSTPSSPGGPIDIFKPVSGHVRPGDYVDYELPAWDRSRPLQIALTGLEGGDDGDDAGCSVDLLVSPRSARQRMPPRETEHVWANFGLVDTATGAKAVTLAPADMDADVEALRISVRGWPAEDGAGGTAAYPYTLRARVVLEEEAAEAKEAREANAAAGHAAAADEEQCANCRQWVPARTMVLHEGFCRRNNVACPTCHQVFQARSAAWTQHWHCDVDGGIDGAHGRTAASRAKHAALFHTPRPCPAETCAALPPFASAVALARHRTGACPSKPILCQFCHLQVPQEGDAAADPAAEAASLLLTGMTPHERADGARTTECYRCDAIVRLRDMRAHLQHHDLDRQRRVAPLVCRNALCGRTRGGVGPRGALLPASPARLGLCAACFAPLYVSTHDPAGKALRRRVERRYLSQLLTGCGRPWCANSWCKTGRANQHAVPLGAGAGTAALLPLVQPLVDGTLDEQSGAYFCVDAENQKRRSVAEMLAQQAQGRYSLAWCIAAVEAEGADPVKAWAWLESWAAETGRA